MEGPGQAPQFCLHTARDPAPYALPRLLCKKVRARKIVLVSGFLRRSSRVHSSCLWEAPHCLCPEGWTKIAQPIANTEPPLLLLPKLLLSDFHCDLLSQPRLDTTCFAKQAFLPSIRGRDAVITTRLGSGREIFVFKSCCLQRR